MSEIRFGGYRITGTVGSGALSTIYKAVQEPLGRVVALKALKTQIAPTSSFGEQLTREAKILADLAHPNVVLLLEASRTASGRPYVVLEHVDGPSLHDVLVGGGSPAATATEANGGPNGGPKSRPPASTSERKKKPTKLSVQASLAVACGICAALEHIHERGVVHRDVKPSNVLLSRSGVVKVIDFGIAQRPRTASMSDALGTEGITASGRMAPEQVKDAFGTPAYMSPEQILGDFVDGRSDLFSLGVVLYQMLSGSRPFEAADGSSGSGDDNNNNAKRTAAQRIRRDAPAPLRERAPHCPRAVERIVMRLLEKSPNERYPSAGAVKERLETALRAETRDDPTALIRAALASAGFGGPDPGQKRSSPSFSDIGALPKSASPPRRRASIGTRRALLGLAAIASMFVLGAVAIEGIGGQARDARSVGPRTLVLAPDHAGGLRVVATPWAYVRVDGQLVETTPFARAIPLSAGKHWVSLAHPDAIASIDREIVIVAGETLTLDVTMNMATEDGGKDASR